MRTLFIFILFIFMPSVSISQIIDRVIAVVNSEPILESDLLAVQERAKRPFLLFELLLEDQDTKKFTKKQFINYLIGEAIIRSEIKRLGLEVTYDRVEKEIRDIAKRNNVTVADIYASFKQEGLSQAEYQQLMKDKIERDQLLSQEIISKVRVSDEDTLSEYFKRRPQAKVTVAEFTLSHIFFSPQKSGGAEAALQRAQKVYEELRMGSNFEKVAEKYSEDPSLNPGGHLGTFKSGEFIPELEELSASLNIGEFSRVVKSRTGFHILKLTGKKLASDPQYEREKEHIRRYLENLALRRQFKLWLQQKYDDYHIQMN